MKKLIIVSSLLLIVLVTTNGCKTVRSAFMPGIDQDVALGLQTANEVDGNTKDYPLLAERGNEQLYAYIRSLTNKIVYSGAVEHAKNFKWQVKIIDNPKVLNAFCAPGGYIYVYTGIIKYLDSEDQLAGVMAHEIAHADRRHSMQQYVDMSLAAGITSIGFGILDKDTSKTTSTEQVAQTVAMFALQLGSLKFSRNNEKEADEFSVRYLCNTEYNAGGAAGFFEKIGNEGSPPEFLSTHPNPTNRVKEIYANKDKFGCKGSETKKTEYLKIKNLIK
jgi:beta-barrel assembly-enhancing protease